jgi:Fe-S-cluster containining protein
MAKLPWYKDGLKFECTQCGNCCTGAPGFVWVNKAEIAALAEEVGSASVEEFESKYVRLVGIRKSLKELPHSNWDCVFFDSHTRHCRVYDARPQQCRTWPFWDSNLRDRDSWQRTCETCPGSGRGKIYQLATIEEQRKKVRV